MAEKEKTMSKVENTLCEECGKQFRLKTNKYINIQINMTDFYKIMKDVYIYLFVF